MNKTIKLTLLLAAATSVVGCQTMPSQVLTPTATKETIEKAKAELDGQRFYKLNEYDQAIEVSDDGVILFNSYLPRSGGYKWIPVVIQDSSFHVSCDYLREFVDAGMVVTAKFVGRGGRIENYNKQRCEEHGEPVWN
ncbi:hypothetical protein ACNO65_17750 [Vibrio campbellii]|uniref:hypothetical protein n=1 Tax=Vibrio campbellii TaxID=680 RepID=UPI003AAB2338